MKVKELNNAWVGNIYDGTEHKSYLAESPHVCVGRARNVKPPRRPGAFLGISCTIRNAPRNLSPWRPVWVSVFAFPRPLSIATLDHRGCLWYAVDNDGRYIDVPLVGPFRLAQFFR